MKSLGAWIFGGERLEFLSSLRFFSSKDIYLVILKCGGSVVVQWWCVVQSITISGGAVVVQWLFTGA